MSTVGGGVNIATAGLVLYLDAANTKSYVSGSTTWSDVSRGGNNGTLINGPTFNSSNGGSIVFDGVNDYTQIPYNIGDNNVDYTINISFKINSFTGADMRLFGSYAGSIAQLTSGFTTQTFRLWLQLQWNNTNLVCETGTNYILGIVHTGTTTLLYVNGVLNSTILDRTSYFNNIGIGNPFILTNGTYFNGNIYQTLIYNRALSAQEVLQNYNATKTRFGL
jgi:hypothetical protein